MRTKDKVALAQIAWRIVKTARGMTGRGMVGCFRRGGLRWKLDLDEGIDFSIYLLGGFEIPTVRFYRKKIRLGDTVFDIGANIGAHTLYFARCVGATGAVHAFEPTEFAYTKLLQNLALNPQLKTVLCNHELLVGPGDQTMPERIYSSWPLNPSADAHPKLKGRLEAVAGARAETLDCYCVRNRIARLDWVKLDVDGNETPVLLGAREVLREFHPNIIMEFAPYVCRESGYDFDELVDIVRSAGYEFLDVETGRPLPADAATLDNMIPDGAGLNVYLKPVSSAARRADV